MPGLNRKRPGKYLLPGTVAERGEFKLLTGPRSGGRGMRAVTWRAVQVRASTKPTSLSSRPSEACGGIRFPLTRCGKENGSFDSIPLRSISLRMTLWGGRSLEEAPTSTSNWRSARIPLQSPASTASPRGKRSAARLKLTALFREKALCRKPSHCRISLGCKRVAEGFPPLPIWM